METENNAHDDSQGKVQQESQQRVKENIPGQGRLERKWSRDSSIWKGGMEAKAGVRR